MSTASTAFDDHLAAGETPVTEGSSVLFEETRWTPAAICVTDHRILFVTDDGGFVDVDRSQVLSIRSRPTTRAANRAIGAQATLIGGVLLALLAAGALLADASGVLVPSFALLAAVGTLGTAAFVVRDAPLDADHVAAVVDRVDAALERLAAAVDGTRIDDALGDAEPLGTVDAHRRNERRVGQFVEAYPLSRWLAAAVGVLGAGGIIFLGAWMALGLTTATLAGVGVAAYGLDSRRALDDRGHRVRRERSVCLYLLGGRTVRFRIDADASIDRELSKLTVGRPALPSGDPPAVPANDRATGRSDPADERAVDQSDPAEQGATTGR